MKIKFIKMRNEFKEVYLITLLKFLYSIKKRIKNTLYTKNENIISRKNLYKKF